jgi:hypothetical protein
MRPRAAVNALSIMDRIGVKPERYCGAEARLVGL